MGLLRRARGGDPAATAAFPPGWPIEGYEPSAFPVGFKEVVGEVLSVAPVQAKLPFYLEVRSACGPVAALSLGGADDLARMVCGEGAWCLNKRRSVGWELVIESLDRQHVGWYSGRSWLPGGTISSTDGTQVDLRRAVGSGWKLEAVDTGQRVADIRGGGAMSAWDMSLIVRSIPSSSGRGSLVFLTACAIVMLNRRLRVDGPTSA